MADDNKSNTEKLLKSLLETNQKILHELARLRIIQEQHAKDYTENMEKYWIQNPVTREQRERARGCH